MSSEGLGFSELLGLGLAAAAALAAGIALGWLLDTLAGTFPLFVFVGLGLGILGACAYAVAEFRKFLKT